MQVARICISCPRLAAAKKQTERTVLIALIVNDLSLDGEGTSRRTHSYMQAFAFAEFALLCSGKAKKSIVNPMLKCFVFIYLYVRIRWIRMVANDMLR